MNRGLILIPIVAIVLIVSASSISDDKQLGSEAKLNSHIATTTISLNGLYLKNQSFVSKNTSYKEIQPEIQTILTSLPTNNLENVLEEVTRPEYELVTLETDLQNFIWELCDKDRGLYDLALSIIYVESKFNTDIPVSKTYDYGLFQINGSNLDISKKDNFVTVAGVKPRSDKRYNPYEFSKIAITHLKSLISYWEETEGVSKDNSFVAVLLSYNRGLPRAKSYIQNFGFKADKYVISVREFKAKLEQGNAA